jgi:hypothetical protein
MTEPNREEPAAEFDEIVQRLTDVPASFLSPAERKKRRPKIDQPALCDEPDHAAELKARAGYDERRGPVKRDAFRDEVRRQREAREKEEPK